MVRFAIVSLAGIGLVNEMAPLLASGNHAVDGAPVRQTSDVTVIDEDVGFQLARECGVVVGGLLGIVTVGGIELYTALPTPVEGIVEEFALATGPEDQTMAICNEHLQGIDGERTLLANLGILVLDDGTIEINGNDHENG